MKELNEQFLQKYAELEQLCRAKCDGERSHLSAVKVFSESLPVAQRESLCNLIQLRNEMAHCDNAAIGAKESDIQHLNVFIAIVKGSER